MIEPNCCLCSKPHIDFEEYMARATQTEINDEGMEVWITNYCDCPYAGHILTGEERYVSDEDDYGMRMKVLDPFNKHLKRGWYWEMKTNVAQYIFEPGSDHHDCNETCMHDEEEA